MTEPAHPPELLAAKAALRKAALEARRHAARVRGPDVALAVRDRFLATFAARLATEPRPVVSGYWPMGDELDLRPLMDRLVEMGVPLALPAVTAKGAPLAFRAWRPGDTLDNGVFGTAHPPPTSPDAVPDIVVAALLAFDTAGGRLGWGGGYYDRTVAALRRSRAVLMVGVAFDAQEVAQVPMGARDQRLDWVITETRALRCAA
jgi:5-formyltetrahydrofolate cyclo-ligase